MRDYSTWMEHRNKKRCIEGGRKDSFTFPPTPLPKAQAAQHRKTHTPHGEKTEPPASGWSPAPRPPQVTLHSPRLQTGSRVQTYRPALVPVSSCGPSFQNSPQGSKRQTCPKVPDSKPTPAEPGSRPAPVVPDAVLATQTLELPL